MERNNATNTWSAVSTGSPALYNPNAPATEGFGTFVGIKGNLALGSTNSK